jgi:hypothetical protein
VSRETLWLVPHTHWDRADLLGNAGTELSVVDGWVDVPPRLWGIATVQTKNAEQICADKRH